MILAKKKILDKGELKRNISKIKVLVAGNPVRVVDLDRLNKMVDRRFDLYEKPCCCLEVKF
jgi:hypothetical protein